MSYSIGEVATTLGISVDTLRYYDKSGLLPFVKRNANGRREFTDNDIHLMRTIVCLKNAGVSVNEIAKFIELRLLGDATLEQRYQLLEDHEQHLKQEINDLEETLSYLKFKKWYYQTAVAAGTEVVHFVPGSNEVDPNLDQQYVTQLKAKGKFDEVKRFINVHDYRNKR
jgi:DNA-binding transcriptional MerR regulator